MSLVKSALVAHKRHYTEFIGESTPLFQLYWADEIVFLLRRSPQQR